MLTEIVVSLSMDSQELLSLVAVLVAVSWLGFRTYQSWKKPTDCGCNGCDVKKSIVDMQRTKKAMQ